MKKGLTIRFVLVIVGLGVGFIACSPKYGCPANGKNVGAERILAGEKLPKAPKFKD
jgi:hypothetical protein